jgi:hypothetical protein
VRQRLGQGHQLGPQVLEQAREVLAPSARLILVEQHVVSAAAAQALGLVPLQGQHALQPGPKALEIGAGAGLDPGLVGQGGGARQFLDEGAGQPGEAVVIAPQLADVGGRGRVPFRARRPGLQVGEQFAQARVGGPLVAQPGEQGELLGPVVDPRGRQVGLLIPGQEVAAGGEQRRFAHAPDQFLVGRLTSHHALHTPSL